MRLNTLRETPVVLFLLAVLTLLAAPGPVQAQGGGRVSRPGEYSGYSESIYNFYERHSQYVTVRDGTRLAVDIYHPTRDGVAAAEPLPVVWAFYRYHRASPGADGHLYTNMDLPWDRNLSAHGSVNAAPYVPGSGATYGSRIGEFIRQDAYDAYDLTEWFAAQPWCNGNVGMIGRSYMGAVQYMAASTQPPHLRAIMPEMALFDLYSFAYPGGVLLDDFLWGWAHYLQLADEATPGAPVDDDPYSVLAGEAFGQHQANRNFFDILANAPFRDSPDPGTGTQLYTEWSPGSYTAEISASGVAIYHLAGWFDLWPRDAALWYNNLSNPQKLLFLDWSHGAYDGFELGQEYLRWFDYWLKGIDNGIMAEPPVYYQTVGGYWNSAGQWPPANVQPIPYYFQAGPSGSVPSINDGLLSAAYPQANGQDNYVVDYGLSTGRNSRWANGSSSEFTYPDLTGRDARALTYTTLPLASSLEITGHPVAHLWITSTASDGDFFVYLEEVDVEGRAHYVTEGVLRASHRQTVQPPFNNLGLPFHPGMVGFTSPLPGGVPVELAFDLLPTSTLFDAGNRIRITVTGVDLENYQTPGLNPAPTVTIYHSPTYPSYVALPVRQ